MGYLCNAGCKSDTVQKMPKWNLEQTKDFNKELKKKDIPHLIIKFDSDDFEDVE